MQAANDMKRALFILVILVALGAAVYAYWRWAHPPVVAGDLILYGNVDLRQAELAFNNSERIDAVLVQEGDHIHRGQVLARLDTSRLTPRLDQAQAMADAQQQVVERLSNGNRPEDIAEARANVQSAQADAANANLNYDRLTNLSANSSGRAVRQQDVDDAKAALDVAQAKLAVNQKALELEVIGPRKEDIAEAQAQLRADLAQAALLKQEESDAEMIAPADGVIRSRLMEPGEMASPQTPLFSVAIIDPKWVRAYVAEPDLGRVHPGMKASVTVDSFPDRKFAGWVGFISPTAEFTPKSVQTEELRSSLVYEVRVFVSDKSDDLRLGMPATVLLPEDQANNGPATEPTTQNEP